MTGASVPLQPGGPPEGVEGVPQGVDLGLGVAGGALGAFVTTLVVGAVLIALVPGVLDRTTTAVQDSPVGSLVYGILCLGVVVLVTVALVLTGIGILVAIPFAVAAYVVWAVGATVAFLAVGVRLVGRGDGWLKPLLVGAGLNGLLTLSGVGGLVAFLVGAAGFGAVVRDWLA